MSATQYQNQNGDQRMFVKSPDSAELEKSFNDAKSYMTSTATKDGVNLYDHLVKCVSRLLTEQPRDPVTIFEDVSQSGRVQQDKKREQPSENTEHALAEEQKTLFEKGDSPEELDDDALQSPLPNLLEQAYYFEQAGIGLGRDEVYRIWLALKQLVDKGQYDKVRFWGKVLGSEKNYYIAEVEQNAEDDADEEEGAEEGHEDEDKDADDEEGEGDEDPLPKSTFKPPPTVPKEERGTGVNKHTFYVCNHPGAPWVKLPTVTPTQITHARLIKAYFTGDLTREVKSYPAFPGVEKNYLRAQIARISATTHVAPKGKFKLSEEEEEGEEAGGKRNYQENEDFTDVSVVELLDEELHGWVHHVLHILPQGRTQWWNPNENADKEDEEGGEEDEEMKADAQHVQEEHGPEILTSIGEDAEIQNTRAWTAKPSTSRILQYACAFVRSNLWPGAYAFARGTTWENIYVGYGHKYSTTDYKPDFPILPANEYTDLPEIMEIDDPSPEDEARARAALEHPADGEEEHEEAENEEEDD